MITKIQAYKSSDGTAHSSLEEAQKAEIIKLLTEIDSKLDASDETWIPDEIADTLIKYRDKFIDILTTKPNSLPKARKINGGTKRRTPKPEASLIPMEQSTPPAA